MLTNIEKFLVPITAKVSENRYLEAVKNALISTLPITMISSIALLLVYLPWPVSYVEFMAESVKLKSFLLNLNQMGMSLLSLYVAFAIGSNLAKSFDLDPVSGGISALFSFLVTLTTVEGENGSGLSLQYLGAQGMFTVIIVSIISVLILKFFVEHKITFRLPDTVPANILGTFESIIPIAVSAMLINFVVHVLGFDINAVIDSTITPIFSMSVNSIFFPMAYILLTGIMWFFGIHPAVLSAIATPTWIVNAEANMAALTVGGAIPNIGVKPFIFTFIFIGGGGGTLPLVIHMMRSKSQQMKTLGRLSFGPGLFNINEPILFGAPIVLNPTLIIPFIGGMFITTIVTYLAFYTGIVPGMGSPLAAEWTVPSLIAGAIVTSSWKGAVLVLVNFVISYFVYLPFFKVFEKQLLIEEQETLREA